MPPLTIVVFGATGDLFKKKLARAFFDLSLSETIPEKFTLIGLSRKYLSHAEFRDLTKDAIGQVKNNETLENFLQKVCYYSIDATDQFALESLRDILDKADQGHGACSNKLYYIATAPNTYEEIFRNISAVGLGVPCVGGLKDVRAWIRIIVEKPFGTDSENAQKLDEILGKSFEEDQIFRIDHYLAKETAQNIYSFRFNNILFSPLWSRKYIDRIEIKSLEAGEVPLERKDFYDKVGALRDFGQNHLLELLSLITMEEPEEHTALEIRKRRAEVLASTHYKEGRGSLILGQYDGYALDAYKESETETYFKARLQIDNERWRGVDCVLEHGKATSENISQICVYFKKTKSENQPNVIYFNIQPDSQICVEMNADDRSLGVQKTMCFDLGEKSDQAIYPYEKLLADAISGDQTLFVSTAEVMEEWRITEEIQKSFGDAVLKIYQKGEKLI